MFNQIHSLSTVSSLRTLYAFSLPRLVLISSNMTRNGRIHPFSRTILSELTRLTGFRIRVILIGSRLTLDQFGRIIAMVTNRTCFWQFKTTFIASSTRITGFTLNTYRNKNIKLMHFSIVLQ